MKRLYPKFALPLLFCAAQLASAQTCTAPTEIQAPPLYSVGWIPYLIDIANWRNYNPKEIAGVGRLIPSPNGQMTGEPLSGSPTCNFLELGEYTYVMKWQENASASDYIENTDIVYLKQPFVRSPQYIRHSQLGGGQPVFCAGTFKITLPSFEARLTQINELYEVTNNSGHYTPDCKCLGVLTKKLTALGVNLTNTLGIVYDNPTPLSCPES